MSFYLNQGRLAQHIDDLKDQVRRVRLLREKLRQLSRIEDPQSRTAVYRCLARVDALETGLKRLADALENHAEDMKYYSRKLDRELEETAYEISRLFE